MEQGKSSNLMAGEQGKGQFQIQILAIYINISHSIVHTTFHVTGSCYDQLIVLPEYRNNHLSPGVIYHFSYEIE